MNKNIKSAMRIYVACLAAYNNGYIHGTWIDCQGKDGESIIEEVQEMLKQSPIQEAEEWAIHDCEGFGTYRIEEYTSLEEIGQISQAIEDSGYDLDLITGVMDNMHFDAIDAIKYIENNYQGEYENLISYAWEFLESIGEYDQIPKHLQYYFDIEAYARDLELNGDIFTIDSRNGIYVLFNS